MTISRRKFLAGSGIALTGSRLTRHALAAERDVAPDLRLRAIVPSRVTRTNVSRETLEALRSRYDETTRAEIRLAVAVIEASAAGLPVLEYAPTAPVAEDFRELTRELSREKR